MVGDDWMMTDMFWFTVRTIRIAALTASAFENIAW